MMEDEAIDALLYAGVRDVDHSPGPLQQISFCSPLHLAVHPRSDEPKARPPHSFVQLGTRANRMCSESTVHTKRLLWVGSIARIGDHRLPKWGIFGKLEGAAKRGRGGKECEWADFVESDVSAFGVAKDLRRTARDVGEWEQSVQKGGRGIWPSGRGRRKMRKNPARRRE